MKTIQILKTKKIPIHSQTLIILSLIDADFELFIWIFYRSHFVKFLAIENPKIYVLYIQIKTDLYKLTVQRQYLFNFTFYLMNRKADHKV